MPNINTLIAMADIGRPGVRLPLQGMAGIVRNCSGIICAPAIKINRPRRMDTWLMLLTGYGVPSMALSNPILVAEKVSVQASLSAETAYSVTALTPMDRVSGGPGWSWSGRYTRVCR